MGNSPEKEFRLSSDHAASVDPIDIERTSPVGCSLLGIFRGRCGIRRRDMHVSRPPPSGPYSIGLVTPFFDGEYADGFRCGRLGPILTMQSALIGR